MNDENNVPLGYSKPQTALGKMFAGAAEYEGLGSLVITVQNPEEMSAQDRTERKSPKITIEYSEVQNESD